MEEKYEAWNVNDILKSLIFNTGNASRPFNIL